MPKKIWLKNTPLLALAVLLSVTVLRADNIVDEIIARVGDYIITRSEFERGKTAQTEEMKERFPGDWQARVAAKQKDVLRELIDQQLLLDKGKELGITGEVEVIKRLDEIRKQMNLASTEELIKAAEQQGIAYEEFKERTRIGIVTQQVVGREVGSRIRINSEEIQAWYQQHQSELTFPEQVKLSEILVSTQPLRPPAEKDKPSEPPSLLPEDPVLVAQAETRAKQLLEELRKGAQFEEVAKKGSNGPTAADGGELGSFKRGELARELEDKTFTLKSGEITDVIRTKQGFLILKVVQHQKAGVPAVKEIEDKIREAIYSQRLEPALRAYLTKLREEAYIDIRPGFIDTGASDHQTKPIIVAAAGKGDEIRSSKNKKKKRFVVF